MSQLPSQSANQNNIQQTSINTIDESFELQQTKNIANESHCTNCGAVLNGKYCHQCGQSSRSMIKFFGEVIKELLDDLLGYDSRLKHSIIPLLFIPGKLTLEYIKGRRFYYVMPFRLYLFTSLLFILAIQTNFNFAEIVNVNKSDKIVGDIVSEIEKENLDELISNNQADNQNDNFGITWDKKEVKYHGLVLEDEGLFKDIMDEINAKADGLIKDPKPFIDELFRLLPYMMFVLLPIFAVFFKIFYLLQKRYYVEHLIFTLHNHCFLFSAILLEIALVTLHNWLSPSDNWFANGLSVTVDWFSDILLYWIVLYNLLAMKRVYAQGWMMTISKTFVLGFIYLLLLSVSFVVTLGIGAYLA